MTSLEPSDHARPVNSNIHKRMIDNIELKTTKTSPDAGKGVKFRSTHVKLLYIAIIFSFLCSIEHLCSTKVTSVFLAADHHAAVTLLAPCSWTFIPSADRKARS